MNYKANSHNGVYSAGNLYHYRKYYTHCSFLNLRL